LKGEPIRPTTRSHKLDMISTLQDLVAPLTEAEFLTHLRDRTVAFIPASGPHRFETMLDWDELNHLIENVHYPIERLSVLRDSFSVVTSIYLNDGGRLDPVAFSSLMDQGANLIFARLDEYVPRLWRLCRQIAEQTGEQVTAEAIVTSGKGGALPLHYNKEDVCVLQIAGSERWQLCGPPVVNPVKSMLDQPAPRSASFFDEVLHAGDFLFLPAGYWHRRENGPGRSLHVSIVFEPPYGRDVLSSLASQLAADETFKQPLTRYPDASALAAHEAALKTRLIDQVQLWSLAGFLTERAAPSKAGRIHIEGTRSDSDEKSHD
jgi:ribosomal protein L16 Arg81 hydroxylase